MRNFMSGVAAASIVLLPVTPALAADVTPVDLGKGEMALFVTGDIVSGDAAKFRAQASKYEQAFVILESEGGSLADAIDIGETIHLKGFATGVFNGSDCNSSCALIWLAGSPRALARSARVGFHAAYTDASGTSQESGVANAMVGRYLTLLNLPEKAIVFATSAPPSDLSWLTSSNYEQTGIDLKVMDDIKWDSKTASDPSAAAPPPVITTVVTPQAKKTSETEEWRKVGSWTVMVDHTLGDGCFLLAGFDNDTVLRIGVNRNSNGGYYVLLGNGAWKSLKAGEQVNLQFQFDNNSPWTGTATGVDFGENVVLLKENFTKSSFWNEFVNSKVLEVTHDNRQVTKLQLTQAKAAFDELVACQRYEDSNGKARDPFAQ